MSTRWITGYKEAAEFIGISQRRLMRMVERRAIRVIKASTRCIMFNPEHLLEDIEEMEQKKI